GQIPGQLRRLEDPEEEVREGLGVGPGGTGEAAPRLEGQNHVRNAVSEDALLRKLLVNDRQGVDHRDAGPEEDRHLAGEVHQVLTGNLLLGQLELHDRLFFPRLPDSAVAVPEQPAEGAEVFGLFDPGYLSAIRPDGDEIELRHDAWSLARVDDPDDFGNRG